MIFVLQRFRTNLPAATMARLKPTQIILILGENPMPDYRIFAKVKDST